MERFDRDQCCVDGDRPSFFAMKAPSSRKGRFSVPNRNEKRSPQFYRDLADDARLLSAALKDRASRSVVAEVAAAFDAAADAFDKKGEI